MKRRPLLNKTLAIKEKIELSGMDALLNPITHIKNYPMQTTQPQNPRAKQHVLPPKQAVKVPQIFPTIQAIQRSTKNPHLPQKKAQHIRHH